MSRNRSIPALLKDRDRRKVQSLLTAILVRLRMALHWASRAVWDVENDLLQHKTSVDCASERAHFTVKTMYSRLNTALSSMTIRHVKSVEFIIANWKVWRDNLHVTAAYATTAQKDMETAAIGRLERAHVDNQVDHPVWNQLLSQATGARWADPFFEIVYDDSPFHLNQPTYRASLFQTIVSTLFNDLMTNVDHLDCLLGDPGRLGYCAIVSTRAVRERNAAILCRMLQQQGAELVPIEVLGHLAAVSTESAIQRLVCAYLFSPAVVTEGISGQG